MFLDMLTADAASKHGHEFSEPQQPNRWRGARRSPLRVLPYATRPRISSHSRSVRGTMGELKEEPEDHDPIQRSRYHDMSVDDLHVPGSFRHDTPPTSPPRLTTQKQERVSNIAPRYTPVSPIAEPHTPIKTTDTRSRRPKTQFSVAVPPPSALPLRKQGIARPRALFQLQTQVDSRFHRPVYELIPLSRIDGSRKVGQLIRRLGKAKENITNEDLAVLRVENYNTSGLSKDSLDVPETREILGIISPCLVEEGSSKGKAQIFLDGAVWNATPGRDGRYNLQCIGTEKHSARWYIPKTRRKRAESPNPSSDDRKLYFAAILPHTTKHPTLASLNKTHMDIYDSYTLNTDLVTQDMLTPLETTTPHHQMSQSSYWSQKETETSSTAVFNVPIDELHRKLIVVSSFWVMLCEGWSSYYTFPVAATCGPTSSTSVERAISLPVNKDDKLFVPYATLPASTVSTRQATPDRHSMSAASPSPSIMADVNPSTKRLSLSGLTFRRISSSTTTARNREADTLSYKSFACTSTQTQTQQSHNSQDNKRDSTYGMESMSNLATQIPTTACSQSLLTPVNVRPAVSRFGSMVRRMSNTTPNQDERSRRHRSISWRWSRGSFQKTSADVTSRSDSTSKQQDKADSAMTSDQTQCVPPSAGVQALLDLAPHEETISANDIISTSTGFKLENDEPEAQPGAREASDSHEEDAKSLSMKSVIYSKAPVTSPIVQETNEIERESFASEVNTEALIHKLDQPVDHRKWSVSSSGSEHVHIGSPYWRDFDRLQTNEFWQRRQDTPHVPASQRDKLAASSSHIQGASSQRQPVVGSREAVQGQYEPVTPTRGRSFINKVRLSIGRRRQSLGA